MTEYVGWLVGKNGVILDESQEIVRCRDCEHYMSGSRCNLQDEYNEFHWLDVEPDGFCKWPSKKNEE